MPAKEGRDLQHVDHFGDLGALPGLVHVGEHRQAEVLAQIGEDRQRLVYPEPALPREARPVRLVEARLVDEADPETCRHLLQPPGRGEGVIAAFELAGAGDQGQRQVVAEGGGANGDMRVRFHGAGL